MHWDDLDTPAVLVDLDVMNRNRDRLGTYCREKNLRLRPHVKTHKVPELARMQIASGAIGVTVAKVGEAEVMADAGITDILIAYPVVGPAKSERLARLAERIQISVALDSERAAQVLARAVQEHGVTIRVLVEIDVGFHRCGLTDADAALKLAQKITELPGLQFNGLMFYPGHFLVSPEQQMLMLPAVNQQLNQIIHTFEKASLSIPVVSGGSTPTAFNSHLFRGVTEIRPGMYLFNDRNMLGAKVTTVEHCALFVMVAVVSVAVNGQAILDGGTKTFSSDRFLSGDGVGFGLVREDPAARLVTMSEEHGQLDVSQSHRKYRIGEKLTVIPNHVCTTINMHDVIYGISGERVETEWRVAARGRVR